MSLKRCLQEDGGAELVEFSIVFIPLLGIIFLILDISWLFFAQSSLQYAVQAGVRYAVTGQSSSGGQDAAIKSIVQQNAMGFLAGNAGLNKISINYYNPANLAKAVSGVGSNSGGNIVQVTVNGAVVGSFGPFFRTTAPSISLSASSSDVMESSPTNGPPAR